VDAQAVLHAGAGPAHGHLRIAVVPPHEAKESRRRVVAQHRPRPARLHGCHEASLERRVRVPDRVDAAIEPVQSAVARPHEHRLPVEPARDELGERQHAPLRRGPPGNPQIAPSVEFVSVRLT